MDFRGWVLVLATLLYLLVIARQFLIVVLSRPGDKFFASKVLVLMGHLVVISSGWLAYLTQTWAASFFILILAGIKFWLYYIRKDILNGNNGNHKHKL